MLLRDLPEDPGVQVPWTSWASMVPLAAGAALLGLLTLGAPGQRFEQLLGAPLPTVEPLALVGSGVLAAAVLAATWWRRKPVALPGALQQWLYLERATHAVVVRPVLALSRALAVFDDQVLDRTVHATAATTRRGAVALAGADDRLLDRAVEGAAGGTVRTARAFGRFDDDGVDRLVASVARGARRLGEQARRPQTGQVHQYYGQAAALLVAATVLLLLVR